MKQRGNIIVSQMEVSAARILPSRPRLDVFTRHHLGLKSKAPACHRSRDSHAAMRSYKKNAPSIDEAFLVFNDLYEDRRIC